MMGSIRDYVGVTSMELSRLTPRWQASPCETLNTALFLSIQHARGFQKNNIISHGICTKDHAQGL